MAPVLNKSASTYCCRSINGRRPRRPRRRARRVRGLKHLGQNPEGWLVAETANFRIFHKQDNGLSRKSPQIAEKTRVDMAANGSGNTAPLAAALRVIVPIPTGQDYSR